MAISTSPQLQERRSDANTDMILEKLARTNTFNSDWPTLRDHLHQSLISTLPLFLSRGPPRPYRPPISPIMGPIPISLDPSISEDATDAEGEKPPSESLLLSPSQPTSISTSTPESSTLSSSIPRSLDVEPSATPSSGRLESLTTQDDLKPSTQGGLVIPPFPPLDRNRRNSSSGGPSYSGGQIISSPSPRSINGIRGGAQRIVTIGPTVLDDEYDEETTIGGKILPGWMDNEEGKKELEKVVNMLDDMDVPPFTIQRLSELLLEPTKYYSTFGKFVRAIEKTLLVTTQWEAPSYTAAPTQQFSVPTTRSTGGSIPSSSSSASSDNGYDSESTMPPGSTTPMFSPIPFLTQQHDELSLGLNVNTTGESSINGAGGQQQRSLDDGLMSPLMLSEESGVFGSSSNPRSPTPEPEDTENENESKISDDGDIEMKAELNEDDQPPRRPTVAQGQYPAENVIEAEESSTTSDPAHQSYLGRVDELDTGPITSSSSPTTPTFNRGNSSSPSSSKSKTKNGHHGDESEIPVPGTGEGGNMTPHGMSEKPVPISSTTVVKDDDHNSNTGKRTIANLPRTSSEKSLRDRFVSAGATTTTENDKSDITEGSTDENDKQVEAEELSDQKI
ncbi:uncharacterized protein L201_004692 [Kwoniella dendrophila CBS 6074]|uniref:PPP4R2-domain-containing protein n=1 Tax=Kwoniella dendrophila CBS 6074 TaxID=1295534 RepID=A0AAX4JWY6_9TREE